MILTGPLFDTPVYEPVGKSLSKRDLIRLLARGKTENAKYMLTLIACGNKTYHVRYIKREGSGRIRNIVEALTECGHHVCEIYDYDGDIQAQVESPRAMIEL